MSDDEDYNSESDADYIPSDGEAVSEEDESGEDEGLDASTIGHDPSTQPGGNNRGKKRKKKGQALTSRRRTGGIKLENEVSEVETTDMQDVENKVLKEEIARDIEHQKGDKEKKKADDLWSSFLTDVNKKGKATLSSVSASQRPAVINTPNMSKISPMPTRPLAVVRPSTSGQMSITKVFDFAGEEVRITKQVDIASKEGQDELKKITEDKTAMSSAGSSSSPQALEKNHSETPSLTLESSGSLEGSGSLESSSSSPGAIKGLISNDWKGQLGKFGKGAGGGGGGGLSSVLGHINKKPTISTLNKSKLDWESFKQEANIEEDLKIHNRGKDGYIERLDFLSRTDQRQFEMEKNMRLSLSSKR